jgi:translation initiation factor eIF-2B subunit epsilon
VIEHCIIGENVRILDNTTLKRGCRLGEGVVVGPNVTLEEFSRVSTRPFRLEEDDDSEDEVEDVLTPQGMRSLCPATLRITNIVVGMT